MHPISHPSPQSPHTRTPAAAVDPNRLTWLLELMGRFARERSEDHDSARIAAAIVIHLRALETETPSGSALAATVEHWLELWEAILDRALARHAPSRGATASATLFDLVRRARLGGA